MVRKIDPEIPGNGTNPSPNAPPGYIPRVVKDNKGVAIFIVILVIAVALKLFSG